MQVCFEDGGRSCEQRSLANDVPIVEEEVHESLRHLLKADRQAVAQLAETTH